MLLSIASLKITSILQEKILNHVCKKREVDYNSISAATKRDRVTILQSLEPLVRQDYIKKNKVKPDNTKSKQYFTPTDKGICYALTFLSLDIDEITAQRDGHALGEYVEPMKNMKNKEGGRIFIKNIAENAIRDDCFRAGKLSIKNKGELFLKSYMMTVLDISISSKGPVEQLFGDNEFEKFKRIFSQDDISIFENSLKNINLNNERLIRSLD